MRLWNLPSWADPQSALRVLNAALNESGSAHAIRESMAEPRPSEKVRLEGFHLFEGGGLTAPYTWLAPKPRGDTQDAVQVWEDFVASLVPAAKVWHPLRVFRTGNTMFRGGAAKRYFGPTRPRKHWFTPAAKLIASLQHVEGQGNLSVEVETTGSIERRRITEVSLLVESYRFHINKSGAYSNLSESLVDLPKAGDASLDELSLRPLVTTHRLAHALLENDTTPIAALQAANVVLRGLQLGLMHEDELRITPGHVRKALADPVEAALALLEETPAPNLASLYRLLVPTAMTLPDFRQHMGNPFRPMDTPRKATVDRWKEVVGALI